jgi:Spy/CpxP family protein refolding chaperone
MITPKLTAVLVAMTALVGAAPAAVFAQDIGLAAPMDPEDGSVTDIVSNAISSSQTAAQVADTSADGNTQINNAEVSQAQVASASCEDDCSASASQEELEQSSDIDQSNNIETGDVDQEQDVEQTAEFEDILQFALDELSLE